MHPILQKHSTNLILFQKLAVVIKKIVVIMQYIVIQLTRIFTDYYTWWILLGVYV